MLLRALVVLLVILNFGVAAWWAARGTPGDAQAVPPADRGSLRLASEPVDEHPEEAAVTAAAGRPTGPASPPEIDPAASMPAPAPPGPPPAAAQCFALGPFADEANRDAARTRLAPVAARTAPRDVGETPRGWRVWMSPREDRASANAIVVRLLEAGFNDYYVIGDGAEANAIALGRFGSEAPARARAEALRSAGFEADAQPLGGVLVRYWVDAMAAEGQDAQVLRQHAGAARAEPRDCDVAWEAG